MKVQMALGPVSENPREGRTDTTTLSDLSQPPLPNQKAQNLEEARLKQARNLLSELKSKYTERHPDIVRTERYIAELEKSIEKMEEVSAAFHSFGEREVLRGIDLQLRGGEIYGLLGPNGAGKTTLMKAICGRLRLTSGTVAVDGRDPLVDRQARRAISFVPQEISIYSHLTVEENLQIFGRFSGLHGRDLVKAVDAMLRRASPRCFRSWRATSSIRWTRARCAAR